MALVSSTGRSLWIAAAAVLLVACDGIIADPSTSGGVGGGGGAGGGAGAGGGTGGHTAELECSGALDVGATPIRRLSNVEYDHTVADLLGDTTAPGRAFPPDEGSAAVTQVSATSLHQYLVTAERLSATAWSERRELFLPCDPATDGEAACARDFVESFGRRAYRRPLEAHEVDRLLAVHAGGESFGDGVQRVVQAMLVSPHFLYRIELGLPAAGGPIVELSGWEVASRLSYLLWRSMPDEALMAAAEAGTLSSAAEIEAHARRMLDDPRVRESVHDIVDRWLGLAEIEVAGKDTERFPEYDDDLRGSMVAETRAFVDWVMWEQEGSLDAFLTAPVTFVDADLAELYGLPVPTGDGLVQVDLHPAERTGILAHASILTINATASLTSPVLRGKLVREQLLCQRVPDPPPGVDIIPPEPEEGVPGRDRWAAHTEDTYCASCHSYMDPIGFGFEAFDAIGRRRTHDEGFPVDDSGELSHTDSIDGAFAGVPDLAQRLSGSEQVRACVARQWFRITFDRIEGAADACSVQSLVERFEASGWDMRELLVGLTQTDAFRYRRMSAEEVAP